MILRARAPRQRRVVGAAHRACGDVELRTVALLEGRHQIDGVGGGHRDLEDADAVERVRLGDRFRGLGAVFSHDADDLFRVDASPTALCVT